MTIKLSKAGKMPCRSWSLQALTTCAGSVGDDGTLVPACVGCYATTGNYRFPNVKQPREHNQRDWKRDSWVDDMVAELDNDRYFRWFDSGDVYSIKLARKILEVMKRTPWTKHWFNSRGLQNAPQETEIESYVIGGIKQDVQDDTFDDFKL